MTSRTVRFVDRARNALATAQVTAEGDHFEGTIDLRSMPPEFLVLFDEFEEIVEGQAFAFLDEIQAKIEALPIKAVFEDDSEVDIRNLQIFPSAGEISFHPDLKTEIATPLPDIDRNAVYRVPSARLAEPWRADEFANEPVEKP